MASLNQIKDSKTNDVIINEVLIELLNHLFYYLFFTN